MTCGKRPYPTAAKAWKAATRLKNKGVTTNVYRCDFCAEGVWHLTSILRDRMDLRTRRTR